MSPCSDTEIARRAEQMEETVRIYFDGCNEAGADENVSRLAEDAVRVGIAVPTGFGARPSDSDGVP